MKVNSSWGRTVLALSAIAVIAAPGLVLGAGATATYATPRTAQVIPASTSVTAGSVNASFLQLFVTFSDGTSNTFSSPTATFGAVKGTVSGSQYTAPSTSGFDIVSGTYSQNSVTVKATRVITILPNIT